MTGNGDFNQRDQLGTSFVKVSPDLTILSWFTPANYRKLNLLDLDLGSAGPVLLPDTGELVGGGKEGRLFLLKQSDLGGLERHTFWHSQNNPPVQSFRGTPGWRLTWTSWIPGLWNEGHHHLHSPVYWRSRSGRHLYIWGEEDNLRSFSYDRATHFNPKAGKSRVRAPEGMPGGILSLSANGEKTLSSQPFAECCAPSTRPRSRRSGVRRPRTRTIDSASRNSVRPASSMVRFIWPHFPTVSTSTDSGRRPRPGLQIGHSSHGPKNAGGAAKSIECNRSGRIWSSA